MGNWFSDTSGSESDETISVTTYNPYRYPPKGGGSYFGSHFIMGGERFETFGDSYLFGENNDLNFLGGKPVPFPYPAPSAGEPTKALKALIYIRKETIKFVRVPDSKCYNIEFVFDSDCATNITIMYFCREELTASGVIYRSQDSKLTSEPVRFKAGAGQVYSNPHHTFSPSIYSESDLQYDYDAEVFPIVIHCVALDGDDQSHSTTCVVDKHGDDIYILKPLKQKLFVDGLSYLLQEIYGIENKIAHKDEDDSQNAECVVCLSEMRDTIILPCRHLCLCHSCADSLRYQASNCPICRSPFRALLQIRAVYKIPPGPVDHPHPSTVNTDISSLPTQSLLPGFEMVPLIEALNGPFEPSNLPSLAARALLSSSDERKNKIPPKGTPEPIPLQLLISPSPSSENYAPKETILNVKTLKIESVEEEEDAIKSIDDDDEEAEEEACASYTTTPIQNLKIGKYKERLSLPSTPTNLSSNISTRSSGESFNSASSTKQLLSIATHETQPL